MDELADIQDGILERLHAGEAVDRDAVLARHPQHAAALREFFALLDAIEGGGGDDAPLPARLGEFRVVREIGRGGMGVVYEAEQTSLKRRVALKVLPPALRVEPRVVQRFRREAEAAGRLRHPGIVPVYSVGEIAGTPFFAMEMVEGRALDEAIAELRARGGPEDRAAHRRWAAELCAQVADALAYAHSRGILHRDVKPANVLLERDGTPRLTDFGLARDLEASSLTLAGEVMGSPRYMSPEQAVRHEAPVDERSDVYSLAVTLYESLTLKLPYRADTTAGLLTALVAGDIVRPRKADPSMPPALEAILLRALAKDPKERYASAAEFAADLRAWLSGERPAAKPRRRWRIAAIGVGIALAALAVYLTGFRHRGTVVPDHVLANDMLARLARAVEPSGSRVLQDAARFDVRLRRVLAREDPVNYQPIVTFSTGGGGALRESVVIAAHWEVCIEGGAWRALGSSWTTIRNVPGGGEADLTVDGDWGTHTLTLDVPMAGVLEGRLDQESVAIRHRARLQVAPLDLSWADPSEIPAELGTSYTWTGEERALLVYDRYPDDYPELVTGTDVDGLMRRVLTPDFVTFREVARGDDGERILNLMVRFSSASGPIPAACEVDLLLRAGDRIGTASFTRDAPEGEEHVIAYWHSLLFHLAKSPDEPRVLLDFQRGAYKEVRLVFRPSREAALNEPDFDRYWGGTHEATVPVR